MLSKKNVGWVVSLLLLVAIAYLSAIIRMPTMASPTVLDYDPFWHYRHAKEIVDNGMRVQKWDLLSFYPPGRPAERAQGWNYTMAIFFKIFQIFNSSADFVYIAKLSPVIMVALSTIPAFLLGESLSNKLGGLTTALFAVLTPTFIGISMAGYSDTDAVVVFYTFLCIYSTLLALKKRSIPYYAFAVITQLMFIYTWTGWIVLMMFTAFIPAMVVFRIIEEFMHQKKLRLDLGGAIKDLKSFIIPVIVVVVVTNILSFFMGLGTILGAVPLALKFSGIVGQPMLVNVSVAELQLLNVFTKSGLLAVANRVGMAPVIFTLFGLPLLVVYKLYKKEKISFMEIFLFMWWAVMLYLITRGLRFSLLFSCAAATSAGYFIGNLFDRMKKNVISAIVFGSVIFLVLAFTSNSIQASYGLAGMQISQNWYDMLDWLNVNADKDSLVATWWDPGHIIAGYTGLSVHADGAHCSPGQCSPYNHNIRIQDMGRTMTTNNESESITILSKYRGLTPEQCQETRDRFGSKIPDEACNPISDMYVIASNDLIGKYYWMSYFGDCLRQFGLKDAEFCYNSVEWFKPNAAGKNYIQLPFSKRDEYGNLVYGDIITLTEEDGQLVSVMNIPEQGIRNLIIKDTVYFQNGEEKRTSYEGGNIIDGMLWVDPGFGMVFFMEPSIRDSIFTKMFFFNGNDLNNFELVYSNPEIRLYKVAF